MKHKFKVTIIGGTGAVGAYFAWRLQALGFVVTILGRPQSQQLNYIMQNGLTITSSKGTSHIASKKFDYVGEYTDLIPSQDLVIVALKQPDLTEEVARQIVHITNKHSIVGIISNGIPFYFLRGLFNDKSFINSVDDNGKINQLLQNRNVVSIQPLIACNSLKNGIIQITRPLESIAVFIGSPYKEVSQRLTYVAKFFNHCGIKTLINELGVHKHILEKLQFALSVNILSALLEKNLGDVFYSEKNQGLIKYVISFVNHLSVALKIGPLRTYEQFKSLIITREHFSSLYHDFNKGKTGEIAALIDAPLELATHLKMPIHSLKPIYELKVLLKAKAEGKPYLVKLDKLLQFLNIDHALLVDEPGKFLKRILLPPTFTKAI